MMRNSELGRSSARFSPLALVLLVAALLLGTTGGAVAGGLITGAKIKDGTVTGADIRNNSLTAVDIRDEPRVYGASAGYGSTDFINDFTSDSYVPIVSKSFSAPAGYLFVTGYVYAEADASLGSDGNLNYAIRLDGRTVQSHAVLDTSTTNFDEDGSTTITLKVPAGTHTVSLVASDSANGSFIRERSINVVWSPTGSRTGPAYVARTIAPRMGNH